MPIKFQYNKTALNTLQKQLKMRQKALPTLQNKESALRLEVRKAKDKSEKLLRDLEEAERRYDYLAPLWNEFEPGLVSIADIDLVTVKVAGVKCPELKSIRYEISPFNTFIKPAWYIDGVAILKDLSRLGIESQKVNLYEKVQIPGYQEAIRKIKRYMEDEENLSKASSKIVKQRHAEEESEEVMEESGND